MSERFELVGQHGDTSGHLRLAYGTDPDDPMLFVLTLTPVYVARVLEKMPPVTSEEITRYAYDNAGDLRAMALREKESGHCDRNHAVSDLAHEPEGARARYDRSATNFKSCTS